MYGKVFLVSVFEENDGSPRAHEVHVCTAKRHFSYTLRVRVMAGVVVTAELNEGRLPSWCTIRPCDGSCRPSYNLLSYMRESVMGYRAPAGEGFVSEEEWAKACVQLLAEARRINPEEDLMTGRNFVHTLFADGDSDEYKVCTGRVHLSNRCDEFGMGRWFTVEGRCNRFDCRPVRVRIPRLVELEVRKHLW